MAPLIASAGPYGAAAAGGITALSGVNDILRGGEGASWEQTKPAVMEHLGVNDAMASQSFQNAKSRVSSMMNNPTLQEIVKSPTGQAAISRIKQSASNIAHSAGISGPVQRLAVEGANSMSKGLQTVIHGIHTEGGRGLGHNPLWQHIYSKQAVRAQMPGGRRSQRQPKKVGMYKSRTPKRRPMPVIGGKSGVFRGGTGHNPVGQSLYGGRY